MQQFNVPPPRMRRWVVWWMSLTALVLLAVGLYVQAPMWVVLLWVAIPLALGLLLLVLSGRTTTAPDGAYGITSHSARSEGRLSVEVPVEQVLHVVPQVINELPRFTLVKLSATGAELRAEANMRTWGERITLEFHPASPTRTEIRARCEPTVGATLIDYGQGVADLRTLLGALEDHAGADGDRSAEDDESPTAPSTPRGLAKVWARMNKTSKIVLVVGPQLVFLVLLGVIGYSQLGEKVWAPLVIGLIVFLVPTVVTARQQRKGLNKR